RSRVLGGLFFLQAEDGIRDFHVTGVQTCALPISYRHNKRIAEPGQERRVLKQSRILIERPGLRPEDRSALKYLRRTLERGDKHPVEREQDKEQNRDQQLHTQHQIHALSFRLLEQRLFFPGV